MKPRHLVFIFIALLSHCLAASYNNRVEDGDGQLLMPPNARASALNRQACRIYSRGQPH